MPLGIAEYNEDLIPCNKDTIITRYITRIATEDSDGSDYINIANSNSK